MLNESIADAIKSVLGEYASSEKVKALDAALRPIYGRAAASIPASWRDDALGILLTRAGMDAENLKNARSVAGKIEETIRVTFGVTDNG